MHCHAATSSRWGAAPAPALPLVPAVPTLRQAEQLVGLTYVPGRFDCVHLAVLAQQRLFGRPLRETASAIGARNPVAADAQARKLLLLRNALADAVTAEDARPGDVVLFVDDRTPDGGGCQWHVGTVLEQGGERWVLHTNEALGTSVLERLADCRRRGLHVDGFYRLREAEP